MNQILENLTRAAEQAKTEESEPNRCQWCRAEISIDLRYCEHTDCEYDGEKWRRLNHG